MTKHYCTTDGIVIYGVGETSEQAIADLDGQCPADEISQVREGYEHDGKLSVIQIGAELYERVLRDGGNLPFDIEGHGRRAIAVVPQDDA